MEANEQYVRSKWERVVQGTTDDYRGDFDVRLGDNEPIVATLRKKAWQAAADFTRQRIEEIQHVKEEIEFLCVADYSDQYGEHPPVSEAAQKRTISRLEVVLADLTKGMKP